MDLGLEGGFSCLKKSVNQQQHKNWIESSDKRFCKLKKTGFSTVFANDILPFAKTAWVNYFNKINQDNNEMKYHVESIVDIIDSKDNIFPKNIDIVTGGFPCQDFSVAGKRNGFNSHRSHNGEIIQSGDEPTTNRGQLYLLMREVISITKPKMFIAENVKGLTSLENAVSIIEKDFSTCADSGYLVVPAKVLNAANYGVPQSRERVLFFGFKKSCLNKKAIQCLRDLNKYPDYSPYPEPTHFIEDCGHNDDLVPFVTCNDALAGLEEPSVSKDPSQQKYSHAKFNPKGQGNNEINLDSLSPTIRSEHHGNIEFRRLSLKHGGMHKKELDCNLKERRLTIRECARLQTFPDEYEFIIPCENSKYSVSASKAYKLIGNAVPPMLAYNIAMNLKNNWNMYFGC